MASDAGVYWIASYPRSGNTWVRFLLTAYFLGPDSVAASSDAVASFVPDLHTADPARIRPPLGERKFIKTHFAFTPSHPLADRTSAAVVLVRHPRDVLLSCIDFHRALGSTGVSGRFDDAAYAHAFIEHGGDPEWTRSGFGTWESFLESWMEQRAFPVLCVRYERLTESTAEELERILKFFRQHPDPQRVAAAVTACSFERMREVERREKSEPSGRSAAFSGSADSFRRGHAFLPRARRGGSLEHLAPGLHAAFDRRFGEALSRRGFT